MLKTQKVSFRLFYVLISCVYYVCPSNWLFALSLICLCVIYCVLNNHVVRA